MNAPFSEQSLQQALKDAEVISGPKPLTAYGFEDFVKLELPPRNCLMPPWLPEKGLAMVFGSRGLGKTFFSLELALAVASGGEFLGWQAPESKTVLYIDGEMPAQAMQERIRQMVEHLKGNLPKFHLITPDLQDRMPNLATPEGQAMLEHLLEGVDLIIVDNISCLCSIGRENDADSWVPVQEWALKMRKEGRTVLFMHHTSKDGNQRGTSKREDVLDTVIELKRPNDYEPSQGARFEVHFKKTRGFYGDDAKPFEAQRCENGTWTTKSLEESNYTKIVELFNDGLIPKEICVELGITKGTVSKNLKKARELGDIKGAQ